MRFLLFIVFAISTSSFSQEIKNYADAFEEQIYNNPVTALNIAKEELETVKENSPEEIDAMNRYGQALYYTDDYQTATEVLQKSLDKAKSINYKQGMAQAHFNIGDKNILEGKFGSAIEHMSEALEIFKKIDEKVGIADCLNGIGLIYSEQGDYESALNYFKDALNYGDEVTLGDSYSYLAGLYLDMEAWDDAKKHAEIGLEYGTKNEDGYVSSASLDVLGALSNKDEKYTEALDFLSQSLSIKEDLEDLQGVSITLSKMGFTYKAMDSTQLAAKAFDRAFDVALEIGAKIEIRTASLEMAKIMAHREKYDSAFYYQSYYVDMNDKINNENAMKRIAEMEAKIEERKKQQEIAYLEQEKAYEKKIQGMIIIGATVIVLLLISGGIVLYKRYKDKQKANAHLQSMNDQITLQKAIIEEKSKDILDSIHYAKRIQSAILPPSGLISTLLPHSFVLYKPKDIVAGDFYWLEPLQKEEEEQGAVLFAAADCTGHGVPGAMVSVVCNHALNRAVREYGKRQPADILNVTRQLVIEEFEKSEEEVKDGMDIALCSLTFATKQNQKQNESGSSNSSELNAQFRSASAGATGDTQTVSDYSALLRYAGANNPLWIIRKGSDEIEEIKADKQPIGKYAEAQPFNNHTIQLQEGDQLYIFSDGFADQFGGDRGKKLKAANFKRLLLKWKDASMADQHKAIDDAFEEWKSDFEQLDDVCVIGVRV